MNVIKQFIITLFSRKSWPYPKTARQVRHVVILGLVAIGVTLASFTVYSLYDQGKSLGRQDMRLAAQKLHGDASNVRLMAYQTQGQALLSPYRTAYFAQLQNDVKQVQSNLAEHQAEGDVRPQVTKLRDLSDKLDKLLDRLSRDDSDSSLHHMTPQLDQLVSSVTHVEDSL